MDVPKQIPYGLCVWSTGVGMREVTKKINERLKDQVHSRALSTDARLRLTGVPDQSIYAIGDCSTIENPKLISHVLSLFEEADTDRSGAIEFPEFKRLVESVRIKFPLAAIHMTKMEDLFKKYDVDKSGGLDLEEIKHLLADVDSKLKSLPATAQVASQQGAYLAKVFNSYAKHGYDINQLNHMDIFTYTHMGSFSYVGREKAVADLQSYKGGGLAAFWLWRSVSHPYSYFIFFPSMLVI